MATRQTKLVIKNNTVPNAPFSGATLLKGEAIVNTADGILMFSGVTSSTSNWTPAGLGGNASFFEVGSNLYDLKIRNKITSYGGASLVGQFLSGTTDGFVLAPISSIVGVDTYVTGFSYTDNVITLSQTVNGPTKTVLINEMTGLTVNGTFSATTSNIGTENVNTLNATGATITTSNVTTENVNTLNATGATITTLDSTTINVNTLNATGATITTSNVTTENVNTLNATGATITTSNVTTENVNTLNATGATITTLGSTTINVNTLNATGGSVTTNATSANDIVNYQTLTSYTQTNDVYVTGATYTGASVNSNNTSWTLQYHSTPLNGPYTISGKDTYTTGGTYNNSTKLITLLRNDGTTGYTVDLSNIDTNDTYVTGGTITQSPSNSNITGQTTLSYNNPEIGTYTLPFTDVFVTGFTYSPTDNSFTLKDNSGNTFSQSINSVSGLSLTNLTAGRVVYVGANGLLTDEAGFTYDANLNVLSVPSNGSVSVGTGGLTVAGDAVVQGSLTVFGPSVSAFTTQLYVEDDNIYLNYNPTGTTTGTSLGAGWTIQDGSGIYGTNTSLKIGKLYNNANILSNSEYLVANEPSNKNRAFYTEINDIIIRNTNGLDSAPDGVRVLAEGDVLDGGTY